MKTLTNPLPIKKTIRKQLSKREILAFDADWAKIRKWGKQTAKKMGIKTYDDIERIAG